MATYFLHKLSNNRKLGLRLCQNLPEKRLAVQYKLAFETSTLMFDLCLFTVVGTGVASYFGIPDKEKHNRAALTVFTSTMAAVIAIKYGSIPIMGITGFRAYNSWSRNTLMVPTNPWFHIFY